MNPIQGMIQDLREKYKKEQENKAKIELLYRARTIRKGQTKCQKV